MLSKLLTFTLFLNLVYTLEDEKYDIDIEKVNILVFLPMIIFHLIFKARSPQHPIHPLLADRSSQREFTGEEISDHDLASIFEASRWAPSAMNAQPWRFVYAKRNSPRFNEFASILMQGICIFILGII